MNRYSEKMIWPDCSPPSERSRRIISSITYLSPDGTANHTDARVSKRELEADVAHDRGDDRVSLEPALGLHLLRAHQHHGVAVDDVAGPVHEDRAIAVAVEGHTHRVLPVNDQSCQRVGRRRSATEVDVAAVRRDADAD